MAPMTDLTPNAPLDLPRLVMRRAGLVALSVFAVAVVLGGLRLRADVADEVAGARVAAQALASLAQLPADDADAEAALARLQQGGVPRHLTLTVRAAEGRLLLQLPDGAAGSPSQHTVSWPLARPDGRAWTVTLDASPDSERHEARANLAGMLVLLLSCIAGMLLAMRWNLRRAFSPLGRLLGAIAGIERGDANAVRALPAMPVRELETLAGAVRHLADGLDAAEARRRVLAQQVLTLQEDERQRLARELHDEFGQRLTALRVDAVWLARRVAGDPALQPVVDGMRVQCEQVQLDIRALLRRLDPFGPAAATEAGDEPLSGLLELLQSLAAGWPQSGVAITLDLPAATAEQRVPRALALALYRISQEALTNVVRHAQAGHATLRLAAAAGGRALDWSVSDDGVGLADETAARHRGNGLAGMRERIWALGGSLQIAPLRAGTPPGLRLSASFAL